MYLLLPLSLGFQNVILVGPYMAELALLWYLELPAFATFK